MSKTVLKLGVLCDTGFLIRLNQPVNDLAFLVSSQVMSDCGCDIGLSEHFGIIWDNYSLRDFRRNLISHRENGVSDLSGFLCVVDVERQHPKVFHGQVLDLVPHRIFGQSDCGNIKLMVARQQVFQIATGIRMQLILRLI